MDRPVHRIFERGVTNCLTTEGRPPVARFLPRTYKRGSSDTIIIHGVKLASILPEYCQYKNVINFIKQHICTFKSARVFLNK